MTLTIEQYAALDAEAGAFMAQHSHPSWPAMSLDDWVHEHWDELEPDVRNAALAICDKY